MSQRIAGIASMLTLFAVTANADDKSLALGDSGWEVFKPDGRDATIFDLNYLTEDLLPDADPIGLRFSRFDELVISISIDPISNPNELIGPVTDMRIGATTLSFAFRF